MKLDKKEKSSVLEASKLLFEAERPLRVLSKLSWDASIKADFFAKGGNQLPTVTYQAGRFDLSRAKLKKARSLLSGDSSVTRMLQETATAIELTIAMLESIGTKEFATHSAELYGKPSDLTDLTKTSVHDLTLFLDRQLDGLHPKKQETTLFDSTTFARKLEPLVNGFFGDAAPQIKMESLKCCKFRDGFWSAIAA